MSTELQLGPTGLSSFKKATKISFNLLKKKTNDCVLGIGF